jgi:hypothetical protein
MATSPDIDPVEIPLDPEETPVRPPLFGTVDDFDDVDDEREDENEAPVRAVSDETDTKNEFRLDERTDDIDEEFSADEPE